MNQTREVKCYLTEHKAYRERKNKNKFLGRLLQKKYPHELLGISIQRLEEIVIDSLSYDRHWRKCLEENEDLRGSDYEDKTALAQAKVLELKYEVGSSKKLPL